MHQHLHKLSYAIANISTGACKMINDFNRVVTRMDTPKPGWTPYVVYTTEILSFLHKRNIISNGKRSLKNQISVRLERLGLNSVDQC